MNRAKKTCSVIPDTQHNLEALLFSSRQRVLRKVAVMRGVSTHDLSAGLSRDGIEVGLVVLDGLAFSLSKLVKIAVPQTRRESEIGVHQPPWFPEQIRECRQQRPRRALRQRQSLPRSRNAS